MKALVTYKKSELERIQEHGEEKELAYYEAHPSRLADIVRSDKSNRDALEKVVATLDKKGIEYITIWRGGTQMYELVKQHDAVIAVGGDGTVLDGARYIHDDTPLVGVNSDPEFSVGFYNMSSPESFLNDLENGTRTSVKRIRVKKNGKELGNPVLNDVVMGDLFGMFRSDVSIDGASAEYWKNTGILVASPNASTAYMWEAMGKHQAIGTDKLQYCELLMREAKRGIANESVSIYVHSGRKEIGLDGDYQRERIGISDQIDIDLKGKPLNLVGNLAARQQDIMKSQEERWKLYQELHT